MRLGLALATSALLVVGSSGLASGQSVGRMLEDDARNAGKDFVSLWVAPFNASGKDWLTAALVLGAGVAISPLDDDIDRWAHRDSASGLFEALKPFRKGGTFFQGNKLVPVAGAVLIAGYVTKNQNLRDGIWGCGTAWLTNNRMRNWVLYRFMDRTRPDPHKDDELDTPPAQHGDQYPIVRLSWPDTSWGDNSFPGGHVANLAACTGFLNSRFEMGVVEPVLYALAAGVGLGRIADRAHWASDQIVGAAFGYALGRGVALRQLKRKRERELEAAGQRTSTALPSGSSSGFYLINDPYRGVGIGWQKSF